MALALGVGGGVWEVDNHVTSHDINNKKKSSPSWYPLILLGLDDGARRPLRSHHYPFLRSFAPPTVQGVASVQPVLLADSC